jgi:hypothetical protein
MAGSSRRGAGRAARAAAASRAQRATVASSASLPRQASTDRPSSGPAGPTPNAAAAAPRRRRRAGPRPARRGPGVERPLDPGGLGVEAGGEEAVVAHEVALPRLEHGESRPTEARVAGLGRRPRQAREHLRLVDEHDLEVRDRPGLVDRVAVQRAAQLVGDAAVDDGAQRAVPHRVGGLAPASPRASAARRGAGTSAPRRSRRGRRRRSPAARRSTRGSSGPGARWAVAAAATSTATAPTAARGDRGAPARRRSRPPPQHLVAPVAPGRLEGRQHAPERGRPKRSSGGK